MCAILLLLEPSLTTSKIRLWRKFIENYQFKSLAGVLQNEKHRQKTEQIPENFGVLFNLLNIIIVTAYCVVKIKDYQSPDEISKTTLLQPH